MTNIEIIQKNYQAIMESIEQMDLEQEVKVITVTKSIGSELMEDMYQAGFRIFAENRPQVLEEKMQALPYSDIEWHFIGSLQRRPVKKIINEIDYLHSLDRLSLAEEIQKRAVKPVQCFLQVNISGEESKSGVQAQAIPEILDSLAQFDKIKLVGLMTMAPHGASEKQLHEIFGSLRDLRDQVKAQKIDQAPCTELSMGMSSDYQVALQEGASMVRIGSALYEGIES